MPLRRSVILGPRFDKPGVVRFPMLDTAEPSSRTVWGEVRDDVLRSRAFYEGMAEDTPREVLLEHFRTRLEEAASEIYDRGAIRIAQDDRARLVQIDDF